MSNHTASRTLVKSAPELWAECSDATSLARHLGAFGEIRITRLEPEIAVAWEGDATSGTVKLEPSGWGTRVVLTATPAGDDPQPDAIAPVAGADPEAASADAQPGAGAAADGEPEAAAPTGAQPVGLLSRVMGRLGFGHRRRPGPPETTETVDDDAEPVQPDAWVAATDAPAGAPGIDTSTESSEDRSSTVGVLDAALDSLGRAHHRPYSRA